MIQGNALPSRLLRMSVIALAVTSVLTDDAQAARRRRVRPVVTPTTAPAAPTDVPVAPIPVIDPIAPAASDVSSFTLINTDSNSPQSLSGIAGQSATIADGAEINLSKAGSALNIRANVGSAGSVVFGYDGETNYHNENVAPYALASDSGGVYNRWTPSVGSHTLTATAFSGPDGTGTPGKTYSITFRVTDVGASVPVPVVTATPTSTPRPTPTPVVTAMPTSPVPVIGSARSTAEPANYSAPIEITKGGTYTGNWRNSSVDSYAVKVSTSAPVIIENCHVAGPGVLIDATYAHANLTVRNCSFHGYTPDKDNRSRGRAIDLTVFNHAVIENNFFENTGEAIELNQYEGNRTTETMIVRYNKVRNINMKFRNSNGAVYANFVSVGAFMKGNPMNAEIAWNDVINEPGKSVLEDIINFSFAGGQPGSWFKVHDNFLKGSYHADVYDNAGSAGGLQIDGEDNTRCAYIDAYNNTVMQVMNGGMGAAAGSNINIHNNRIISSGRDPRKSSTDPTGGLPGSYGGVWTFKAYATDPNPMSNIKVQNNLIGWQHLCDESDRSKLCRNDLTSNLNGKNGNDMSGNTFWPDVPITLEDEANEYQLFLKKVQAAGIAIGPQQ